MSNDVARRWAWAEIDPSAIAHNVAALGSVVAPADVWAIVKADGYGHGAIAVAEAALAAGAAGLGVALVEEGIALRASGITAPILVLSEQPDGQLVDLIRHDLTPFVYRPQAIRALREAVDQLAAAAIDVHLHVDTGMQRVGANPTGALGLIESIDAAPQLNLAAISTHLAVADEPDHEANTHQLALLDDLLEQVRIQRGELPAVHVANSAGALAHPAARRSFVRAGIAIYGISPGPGVDDLVSDLRPALALKARVSAVKEVAAGSHVSYGWRHRFDTDTTVATVPIGYADGVPRRLGTLPDRGGHDVLIGGRRCPIVGVVTMDQLMVDVGHLPGAVCVGDDVVLIGRQGTEQIRVEDWADRLGTIGYEIVCGISKRIERVSVDGFA